MPTMVALPFFAVAAALWTSDAPAEWTGPAAFGSSDRESASFALCNGPVRQTCVIDGDTLWYRGTKIRIADINAPEISSPKCSGEALLGHRATLRLQTLLNQGAFTLAPNPEGRRFDTYGRSLMVITRNGASIGSQLVREGLAERWKGYRGSWC